MLTLPQPERQRLRNAARTALKAGRFDAARTALQRLALADPRDAALQWDLSDTAYRAGDRAACLSHLHKAVALAPESAKLLEAAARRLADLGDDAAALALHDRRIALDPKAIGPRADRAWLLQRLGRLDEAEAAFRALIRKHPHETELYRMMAPTLRFAKGDPLIRDMQRLFPKTEGKDGPRMQLGFALAKAMDDTGRGDRVFGYLNAANAAQARLAPFDAAALQAEIDALLDAQAGATLDPAAADDGPRPVFVCGMPRSGTTLVERLLARHPAVTAGGELGHAYRELTAMFGAPPRTRPLAQLDPAALGAWADRYRALALRDTAAVTPVFTDKAIRTERIFGYVRRGLPGARLIVVHRDPRDIALSIYRNHFALGTHRYACRLADIATVIKAFRTTVAHWRTRMPGAIHEIRYEDLVSEPETQTRALVAAAGLDWDDACLDPDAGSGSVRTLSLGQVRQPVHAGRKAAWRRFEQDLQPFVDAWGDTPWD